MKTAQIGYRKGTMNRQAYEAHREDDPLSRVATRSSSAPSVETSEPIVPRHPLFPSRLQVEEIEIPSSTDLLEMRRRRKAAPSYDESYRRWQPQSHPVPQSLNERWYNARYADHSNNRGLNRGGDDSIQRRHVDERSNYGYEQSTADSKPPPVEREYYDESRGCRSASYNRNDQDDCYCRHHSFKHPSRHEQQDRKQSSYQHFGYSPEERPHWEDLAEKQFLLQRDGNHHHHHHQQQQQQPLEQKRLIEVSPGLELPLYGAKETQQALVSGHMNYTSCMICQLPLYCIDVAKYVLCPSCLVVSPVSLESSDERSIHGGEDFLAPQQHEGGGVGFGMSEEEFLEYHRKNAQRNSRRPLYR